MKSIFIVLGAMLAIEAIAIPSQNKLIRPDKVARKGNQLTVTYSLPCKFNDVTRIILSSDDTGDLEVAVGVVYSAEERNCKRGPVKAFTEQVDLKKEGLTSEDITFHPMDASTYSRKLEAYVRPRLRVREGEKSVDELISADAKIKMETREETLECLGYPSWEGNAKAVGVCLVDAWNKNSDGGDLKSKYAIVIGDDTEHPGEARQWSVHPVSYML